MDDRFSSDKMIISAVDSDLVEIIGQPKYFKAGTLAHETSVKENNSAELDYSGFKKHGLQSSSVVSCILC